MSNPRTTITFTAPQDTWLAHVAREAEVPVAEIVRRLVEAARVEDKERKAK
jgi:hypothetical protein